jgi:PadR family transcriptional regulator PadR
MKVNVGQVEQQVLLAILRKHPNAYGVSICEELSQRTGCEPAIATVYATLDKLDKKGFVKPRQGLATAERGGRAKIFFEVTGLGHKALNASLNALDNLREGVCVGKAAT